MARAATIVAASTTLPGCPFPLPSEVLDEADGGVDCIPVIQSASPEDLSFPGPMVVDRGDDRLVTLRIHDCNVKETLYVRMFRDYRTSLPTPFLVDVQIPPTDNVIRERPVLLSTWCAGLDPADTSFHVLEAMVADGQFLDCGATPTACEGQPLFRELGAGSQSSRVQWTIICNPPE
jgi:hypothetical protein